MNVHAECAFYVYSSDDLPVENVEITLRNISDNSTLWVNSTDVNGYAFYSGVCENSSTEIDYPASGYSALLSNASVASTPHINEWVTAKVQLKNTLGSYLEGQDCSVAIYGANTSILIHDYDTACHTGDYYVDKDGNWVSVADCKLTDSRGWYYFKGRTDEDLGFEYNKYYDLVFICNGKTKTVTFKTLLEKQPDMVKTQDFIQQYGGILFLYFFVGVILILLLAVIIVVLLGMRNKGK